MRGVLVLLAVVCLAVGVLGAPGDNKPTRKPKARTVMPKLALDKKGCPVPMACPACPVPGKAGNGLLEAQVAALQYAKAFADSDDEAQQENSDTLRTAFLGGIEWSDSHTAEERKVQDLKRVLAIQKINWIHHAQTLKAGCAELVDIECPCGKVLTLSNMSESNKAAIKYSVKHKDDDNDHTWYLEEAIHKAFIAGLDFADGERQKRVEREAKLLSKNKSSKAAPKKKNAKKF